MTLKTNAEREKNKNILIMEMKKRTYRKE